MTGRRSARRRTTNARSTPSPSRGLSSPARATQQRARQAMESVEKRLIRRDERLMLLFSPPFDRTPAGPRLHQGIRPRHSGERRAVHARGNLVGRGLRHARRGRQGPGALQPAEPHSSREPSGEHRSLQGGAVRRSRRCLFRTSPRRARGMDLVHGRCGLALPRGPRVDSRLPQAGLRPPHRSLHSPGLEALRDQLTATAAAATGSASRTRRESAAACRGSASTEPCFRPKRSYPCPTMVRSTGSR